MTDDSRIKQFEQMASADPDNELGHFSLGRAYLGAERFDDAAVSFARVVQLNPKMSKAYQLLGEALDGSPHSAFFSTSRRAGNSCWPSVFTVKRSPRLTG